MIDLSSVTYRPFRTPALSGIIQFISYNNHNVPDEIVQKKKSNKLFICPFRDAIQHGLQERSMWWSRSRLNYNVYWVTHLCVRHRNSHPLFVEGVKMDVSLSFTRVRTGTLANARGLRFINTLLRFGNYRINWGTRNGEISGCINRQREQ